MGTRRVLRQANRSVGYQPVTERLVAPIEEPRSSRMASGSMGIGSASACTSAPTSPRWIERRCSASSSREDSRTCRRSANSSYSFRGYHLASLRSRGSFNAMVTVSGRGLRRELCTPAIGEFKLQAPAAARALPIQRQPHGRSQQQPAGERPRVIRVELADTRARSWVRVRSFWAALSAVSLTCDVEEASGAAGRDARALH